jgi:predicted  nucleic acid-binding Zn-ribbon protein
MAKHRSKDNKRGSGSSSLEGQFSGAPTEKEIQAAIDRQKPRRKARKKTAPEEGVVDDTVVDLGTAQSLGSSQSPQESAADLDNDAEAIVVESSETTAETESPDSGEMNRMVEEDLEAAVAESDERLDQIESATDELESSVDQAAIKAETDAAINEFHGAVAEAGEGFESVLAEMDEESKQSIEKTEPRKKGVSKVRYETQHKNQHEVINMYPNDFYQEPELDPGQEMNPELKKKRNGVVSDIRARLTERYSSTDSLYKKILIDLLAGARSTSIESFIRELPGDPEFDSVAADEAWAEVNEYVRELLAEAKKESGESVVPVAEEAAPKPEKIAPPSEAEKEDVIEKADDQPKVVDSKGSGETPSALEEAEALLQQLEARISAPIPPKPQEIIEPELPWDLEDEPETEFTINGESHVDYVTYTPRERDKVWGLDLGEFDQSRKQYLIEHLTAKSEVYATRLAVPETHTILNWYKKRLVDKVIDQGITKDSFMNTIKLDIEFDFDESVAEEAWNIIANYVWADGASVVGGAGFGEESAVIEEFSSSDLDNNSGQPEEVMPPETRPFGDKKSAKIFSALSGTAKKIFTDIFDRRSLKGDKDIILNEQSVIDDINRGIESKEQELETVGEEINSLEQQLSTIEDNLEDVGNELSDKEKRSIDKERGKLERQISELRESQKSLPLSIENSQSHVDGLGDSLEVIRNDFLRSLEEKIEPYKQELANLEAKKALLEEDRNSFEEAVTEFELALDLIQKRMDDLVELPLSASVKKTLAKAFKRKIKNLESGLKIAHSNIAHVSGQLDRLEARIEAEKRKLTKWEEMKDIIESDESADSGSESLTGQYGNAEPSQEQVDSSSDSEDVVDLGDALTKSESEDIPESPEDDITEQQDVNNPETEEHTFPVDEYIERWNNLATADDMDIDKETFLEDGEIYHDLASVEKKIEAFVFGSLSKHEADKPGNGWSWWMSKRKENFEKNLKGNIKILIKSLRQIFGNT